MAALMPKDLSSAAAQGDLTGVEELIRQGVDINKKSRDGMTPLSVAAFWGYTDIARVLIEHGADVNAQNNGTHWSPLHCACFQGHGPVVMRLMAQSPNLQLKDMRGRTAIDFASALDSIWPFFAAAKCRRTPKSQLIQMDVVQKVSYEDPSVPREDMAHFSRPGSAYIVRSDMASTRNQRDAKMETAAMTGDVLASLQEESSFDQGNSNSLKIYHN